MKPFRPILRDCRGTTIIEFALIAPLFLLIFFAVFEYGLIMFTQTALEHAVAESARSASISTQNGTADRVSAFRTLLQQKTDNLLNSDNMTISANVVTAGGGGGAAAAPEICLTKPPSSPATCPSGTAYIDSNGNGAYDGPGGISLGNTGDIVEIRASLPWRVQFPYLDRLFVGTNNNGDSANGLLMLTASTVIKNE